LDLIPWRERHTPETWKRALALGLDNAALFDRIRDATLAGRPLGSDEFLERLEREFSCQAHRNPPGRPRKPPTHTESASSTQLTLPGLPA
jgi:hypothetical protein